VGFQYETKEPVFRKMQKEVVLGPFLTNATEAMHETKPGYDPLVDPWTAIAPGMRLVPSSFFFYFFIIIIIISIIIIILLLLLLLLLLFLLLLLVLIELI
jgi:hypothetical protein